jgi:hypothetical protein
MKNQPVVFKWQQVELVDADGVATKAMAMVPHQRYDNVAKRQFQEGETYPLQVTEERSMASHKQFFAAINEGFKNLPENISARFPTATHLRRWLLVQTGWHDEDEFSFDDEKDALRLARWIRSDNEFCVIHHRKGTKSVIVRRPRSQDLASMSKQDFEASKRDVLDLLESMVNVPRGTLMKEAGRSA